MNEEEIGSWAVLATWDESFNTFYLWTGDEQACKLTSDWKSDDPADNIWGFFVSEDPEAGSCPWIEELGWTYSFYTYDEETMMPLTMTGPWGNEWTFKDAEVFA